MARGAAGRQQDDVDADVVAGAGVARHQHFGGGRDARQAAFVDREIEVRVGRARLYLDERDKIALARDEVDLTGWRADAAVEDSPPLEPQPPAGNPLAAPAG